MSNMFRLFIARLLLLLPLNLFFLSPGALAAYTCGQVLQTACSSGIPSAIADAASGCPSTCGSGSKPVANSCVQTFCNAAVPPPSVVSSVSASMNLTSGVTSLGWTGSAGAGYYKIRVYLNGAFSGATSQTSTTNTSLSAATVAGTYTYLVSACTSTGICSAEVSSSAVTLSAPAAPILNPLSGTTGTYTVSWSPVINISSYVLQEDGTNNTLSSGTTTYSVVDRSQGIHSYKVQGCNVVGCGSWSAPVAISVLSMYACGEASWSACSSGIPGAISNVTYGCPAECGGGYTTMANGCIQTFCNVAPPAPVTSLSASLNLNTGVPTVTWIGSASYYNVARRQDGVLGASTQVSASNPSLPSVPVAGNYSYVVSACSYQNTCSSPVESNTVNLPAPTISSAYLSPATISEGEAAVLYWSSTYTNNCTASGISGVSATSGAVTYYAPTVMAANQTVTIPVTCSGAGGSVVAYPSVTVNWVNDAPVISAAANITATEDTAFVIPYSASDEETPLAQLAISATSSDQSKIANSGIVVDAANNRLVITPVANANGSVAITLSVTDGNGASVSTTTTVYITPVNDAPTISPIANQTINEGLASSTGPLALTVTDADGLTGVTISVASNSNPTVIPTGNIVLSGIDGAGRASVTLTAAAKQAGSSTIVLSVSDGMTSVSTPPFTFTVIDLPAQWISGTGTSADGTINLNWQYGRETVMISETTTSAIAPPADLAGEFPGYGTKTISRPHSGTYTYSLSDCYHDPAQMGKSICTPTGTQTIVVTMPAPAAPTLSTSVTNSPDGVYAVSWTTPAGTDRLELYENGVLIANDGSNLLATTKTYTTTSAKTTGAYTYKVHACNSTGCSNFSPDKTVNVAKSAVPTGVGATINTLSAIPTITWTAAAGATRYEIQQSVGSSGVWSASTSVSAPVTTSSLPAVTAGTYLYRVQGCADVNGYTNCSGWATSVSASVSAPAVPVLNPVATSTDGNYTLSWNATANTSYYTVNENGTNLTPVVLSPTTSYPSPKKVNGVYTYQVTACNAAGCSAPSAAKAVTVAAMAALGTVTATISVATGIPSLSWTAVDGATRYDIQPLLNGANSGAVKSISLPPTTLPAVSTAGSYVYQVTPCVVVGTYSRCGTSVRSAAVTLQAPPAPVVTPMAMNTTGSFTVSWTTNTNASNYIVNENAQDLTLVASLPPYPLTRSNGTYSYKVKGCNIVGCGNYSASASIDVVHIDPLASVTASLGQMSGVVTLSWAGVANVDHYEIQPKLNGANNGVAQSTNATSIGLNPITQSGTYSYAVRACALVGSSSNCSAWITSNTVAPEVPPAPVLHAPLFSTTGIYGVSWSSVVGAFSYQLFENGSAVQRSNSLEKLFAGAAMKIASGTYNYQVQACKVVCGPLSAQASTIVTLPSGSGSSSSSSSVSSRSSGSSSSAPAFVPDVLSTALTNGTVNSLPITDVPLAPFVGTVNGQFRVSESGAATYAVPVAVAEGTAGVKPQISINYSSQSGDGIIGLGWSLSGVSAISRCRQTLSQDSATLPITWGSTDRFCLDGQRLMLVSGSYGASGSTYKTEMDTFVIVTAVGGTTGNPDQFTVTAKDGSLSTFGGTPDAKVAGQATLTWAINRFQDSVGNRIDYLYTGDASTGQRIQRINYAYNAPGTSSNPNAHIDFAYDNRNDPSSAYVAGSAFKQTQRLKNISTYNSSDTSNLLRSYNLTYKADPVTGPLSRLDNVQECSASGCLPATQFSLTPNAGMGAVAGITGSQQWFLNLISYQFGDINGDGITDLVTLSTLPVPNNPPGTLVVNYFFGTSSGGFTLSGSRTLSKTASTGLGTQMSLRLVDLNGDGLVDVLVNAQINSIPTWFSWLSSIQPNSAWTLSPTEITLAVSNGDNSIGFGDVDSSGHTSAYQLSHNLNSIDVYKTTIVSGQPQFVGPTTIPIDITALPSITLPSGAGQQLTWKVSRLAADAQMADFDGDGRADIVVTATIGGGSIPGGAALPLYEGEFVFVLTGTGSNVRYRYYAALTPNGYRQIDPAYAGHGKANLIDINQDGLTDIVYSQNVGGSVFNNTVEINTGTGFTASPLDPAGTNLDPTQFQFADINGDGNVDFIYNTKKSTSITYRLWDPAAGQFSSTAKTLVSGTSSTSTYTLVDANGDGGLDLVKVDPDTSPGTTGLVQVTYGPGLPANMLQRITNGLGAVTDVKYGALNGTNNHYATAWSTSTSATSLLVNNPFPYLISAGGTEAGSYDATKPVLQVAGTFYVVTQASSSAPLPTNANAESSVSYFYNQMLMQAAGRGMLGFASLTTVDDQSGIHTQTRYRQDWPYIGVPLDTTVTTSDGKTLSSAHNTWAVATFGTAGSNAYYQPSVKTSVDKSFTLYSDGTAGTTPVQTITTDTTMVSASTPGDDNGNVDSITVTTAGGNQTLVKKTQNTYLATTFGKRMGRLASATVSTTRNGVADTSRTASFTYVASGPFTGMLSREVIAGDDAPNSLTTDYQYDEWGNKSQVSVTGMATATQSQTRNTYYTYDNGRYLASTLNDLSQSSGVTARNNYGSPAVLTDANGVTAQRYTDAMGQEYLRVDATGAWSRTDTALCSSSPIGTVDACPAGAVFYTLNRVAGGGMGVTYADILGRTMRSGKISFDGHWVYTDTEYDSHSRPVRQSTPYIPINGETPLWTSTQYDVLGRVVQATAPDNSVAKNSYPNDTDTVVTNALNQSRTETRNGLGQLVQVTDQKGGTIVYTYNNKGDLLSATTNAPDAAAPVTVLMCYDTLGRKVAMFDPDKGGFAGSNPSCSSTTTPGWWTYTYNAFGELVTQRDPKGQSTVMGYDVLGRMLTRNDLLSGGTLESHTRWFYDKAMDGSFQQGAQGKVTAVVMSADGSETCGGANHCTVNSYDIYARPTNTLVMYPNDSTGYITTVDYDSIGRAYQSHDALAGTVYGESGVQTQYNAYGYAYRTLDRVPRDGSQGELSKILAMNARGQVTQELRGNGAQGTNTYDPATGLLTRQYTTNALGSKVIQDNSYTWDTVGNLASRASRSGLIGSGTKNLQEGFCYDGLNRLVATLPGTTPNCAGATADVTYDGLGNIISKKGVGTYQYGNHAGPHAVTSTSDGVTYQYDTNGNMSADTSRSFTYTSYDLVKHIAKGSNSSDLQYGPDRARWQRKDTLNGVVTTTTYIGNLERIQVGSSSTVEWKRYIGGTIQTFSSTAPGSVDKRYAYTDHLGSLDVITDAAGTVSHSESFDPWGARRNGETWASLTDAQRVAALKITTPVAYQQPITTRGFTGHEMVDDMGIINMNGRIYDPRLARFLQADPHVDGAGDTQGYNRYSYVHNNPLNATDPSGFSSFLKVMWDKIRPFVGAIVTLVANYYCGCGALIAGMIGGAAGAAATGGSIIDGALFGGLSGAAYTAGGALGSALWGGVQARMTGGNVGQGFLAAGIGGLGGGDGGFSADGLIRSAILGGIATRITGGKFVNGAATAAFMYIESTAVNEIPAGGGDVEDNEPPPPTQKHDISLSDSGLANTQYQLTVLGKSVDVNITASSSEQVEALSNRIDSAFDRINSHVDDLSDSEIDTIQNIHHITVDETRRTGIISSTGTYNLRGSYIMNSSTAWLASTIAHDSYHVLQYQRGERYNQSTAARLESEANIFQISVGRKLGLSTSDINYINNDTHTRYNTGSY